MTTAVIDLGTNTFNLLIRNKSGVTIYHDRIPVKLGQGGIDEDLISEDAFKRGIGALQRYRDVCKLKEVDQVFAFATSAVRGATNGHDFVLAAEEECGIKVNVISGDQEAELIHAGVNQAIRIGKTPVLIADIGGGSTELVIADKDGILWEKSFPLGVSRLLEKFKPSDPLSKQDISNFETYFKEILRELPALIRKYKPKKLVGSSGSFETLHDICALRFGHEAIKANQTSSRIYRHELKQVTDQLLGSTMTERLVLPGMLAMRADTLHISSLQIKYLLEQTKIEELIVSLYALKEGVIASINKPHEPWQVSSL